MRTTLAHLQAIVDRINRTTGNALTPYRRELDAPNSGPALEKGETRPYSHKANIGNYHLDQAYGGVALYRMVNEAGGCSDVLRIGHVSKRELEAAMHAFIAGIDAAVA